MEIEKKKTEDTEPTTELKPVKKAKTTGEKQNLRLFAIGFVGLVGVVLVCLAGVGTYRVYAKTATDQFTVTVARVLHLPALKLGDTRILYTDYVDDLKALKNLRSYENSSQGSNTQYATLTDKEISEEVLMRLIDNALVAKFAKKNGVSVTQADMDASKAQLLQNFTDTATAEKEIKSRFGWDMDTYVKKVIYPYNLKLNLNNKIVTDTSLQKSVYDQAMSVLQKIKDGADFAGMAKQYGKDGTASSGGDLGWFGKGVMVQSFENGVFALKKGELGSSLVQTQYGYHIVKVTDRKSETTTNSDGTTTSTEQVKASHILFPFVDVNTFLDEKLRKEEVHVYIKADNPVSKMLISSSTSS